MPASMSGSLMGMEGTPLYRIAWHMVCLRLAAENGATGGNGGMQIVLLVHRGNQNFISMYYGEMVPRGGPRLLLSFNRLAPGGKDGKSRCCRGILFQFPTLP